MLFGFQSLFADTWVNGYYKSNGTYVPGHYRTHKNRTRNDNYSTIGNYNPYTGKPGTKPRDSFYDPFKKRKKTPQEEERLSLLMAISSPYDNALKKLWRRGVEVGYYPTVYHVVGKL